MKRAPAEDYPFVKVAFTQKDLEAAAGAAMRAASVAAFVAHATLESADSPTDVCSLLEEELRELSLYLDEISETVATVERAHGVPLATLADALRPLLEEEERITFQAGLRNCLETLGVQMPTEVAP